MSELAPARTLDLDGSWAIGGKIHGGYLLSQVVDVALEGAAATHPHPLVVSAQFLSAPDAGPADVALETLRVGRTTASVRARLSQAGRVRTEVLLTAGTLPTAGEAVWTAPGGAPDLPPLEDCPRTPFIRLDGVRVGHLEHVDFRPDPATTGWARGEPRHLAEMAGWLRPDPEQDGPAADDPLWLLVATDALPPVTFDFGMLGWVPTVSLDIHLRARPTGGWLRGVQRAQRIADGWLDETCDLYDAHGRLVASGRQLAGYRP